MRNVVDVVRMVMRRKESALKVPSHALFVEVRAELPNVDEGSVYAMLDAAVAEGELRQVRTIYGFAYIAQNKSK